MSAPKAHINLNRSSAEIKISYCSDFYSRIRNKQKIINIRFRIGSLQSRKRVINDPPQDVIHLKMCNYMCNREVFVYPISGDAYTYGICIHNSNKTELNSSLGCLILRLQP